MKFAYIGILLSVCLCSCLKEQDKDECSFDYTVTVEVRDKNYFNISDFVGLSPVDEQLPFRMYVKDLSYSLLEQATGNPITTVSAQPVTHNDQITSLIFPSFKEGDYILDISGNTIASSRTDTPDSRRILHPNGAEGTDIYVGGDTLSFHPKTTKHSIELQRAKGYLMIQLEGVPDSVSQIGLQLQNVYGETDPALNYAVKTSVNKLFTREQSSLTNLSLYAAPTPANEESILKLASYSSDATQPFMYFPDIVLKIKRNEISSVKINYKPEGGIEIWVYADGGWSQQHNMDLE